MPIMERWDTIELFIETLEFHLRSMIFSKVSTTINGISGFQEVSWRSLIESIGKDESRTSRIASNRQKSRLEIHLFSAFQGGHGLTVGCSFGIRGLIKSEIADGNRCSPSGGLAGSTANNLARIHPVPVHWLPLSANLFTFRFPWPQQRDETVNPRCFPSASSP